MDKHEFEQAKDILKRMVDARILGQSWLDDDEYQKKLDRKRKQIDQQELL